MQRIQDFLTQDEVVDGREAVENPDGASTRDQQTNASIQPNLIPKDYSVRIDNASTRRRHGIKRILEDITAYFPSNKVSTITGPVGCGKSTLLKMLLGEEGLFRGTITVNSEHIAYCDQVPWLRNCSIRENIIGDAVYSSIWYEAILFACHLLEDLDALPDFDDTIVGNGGCNLSVGQKQRVVSLKKYPLQLFYKNRAVLM